MFFTIDPSNGVAIYDQIVRQMKYAVADKALVTGELVPSVRELAKQLAVNPNTVARAYRQLQEDRVLLPIRGTGLQVAPGAAKRCAKARQTLVQRRLRDVLGEVAASGLSQGEVRELMNQELDSIRWENSDDA